MKLNRWKSFAAVTLIATSLSLEPAIADSADKTTLSVAMMWESNPLSIKSRRSRFFNESEVLDTLVKLDYDLQMVPGLALSWDRTSDTEWLFTLREGVKFHDGSDFTAESVIYSLERVLALLPYAPGLLDIADMETVGANQVKIRTNKPFAALPNQLTDAITGIYGKGSFDGEGKYVSPVGTGPFEFESFTKQDRTVVTRFDGYWGDAPTLEKIIYRYIPDHSARILALEAGEVDMAINVPPADVKRLDESEGFTTYREPAAGLYYMVLNTDEGSPFSDVRVRTAVNLMVDREALVTYGLDGVGIPAGAFFSPEFNLVPGEAPTYSLDLERAKNLLQDAGYAFENGKWAKDGTALSLKLISYTSRVEMPTITEIVSVMLKENGIDSSIEMFTWPGMQESIKTGNYDGYTVFWTPEMTGHPDTHLKAHFTSNSTMMNNHYSNLELDKLLVTARGLDAGGKRDATYQNVLEIIHQDAPIMPLVHKIYVAASQKGVEGFRVHPSGFFFNFKAVTKK